MYINDNFFNLKGGYLFPEIQKRTKKFKDENPDLADKVISLGIGDVTRPVPKSCIKAMHLALDEMTNVNTMRGYGPELGYDFLKEAISNDYKEKGILVEKDEIFISEGINADISNFGDVFSDTLSVKIAVTDPVYPVYVDVNVMAGRSKGYNEEKKEYEGIVYLPLNEENDFKPEVPKEKVDVIYLCSPNNPTGEAMTYGELKKFIDYALKNDSLILYDGAYEAYIQSEDVPHSIYEIKGAEKCCVEFRSFSKSASFAGIRCAYTIVPKNLEVGKSFKTKQIASINELWARRHATKQNGCSYITQRGAEACFTKEGKDEINQIMEYYHENANIILDALKQKGIKARGGINSPYIWFKVPEGYDSWTYFDYLLNEKQVVTTPGVGFGKSGEGYIRITAFASRENTIEAVNRILSN